MKLPRVSLGALSWLVLGSVFAAGAAELPHSVQEIFGPVWVGRPPSDAFAGLVRLENGEIRHYDYGYDPTPESHHNPDFLASKYIFSRDQGLHWDGKDVPPGHFGADMRSPISGEYLRLQAKADGIYVIKTKGGIDGEWSMHRVWEVPIRDPEVNLTRTVVFTRKGKRAVVPWCTARRFGPDYGYHVGTLYSDDDGETWQHSNLIETPAHVVNERDKSVRWQNGGTEPTVVELKDGRLWMIIRTSQDYHWQSFSNDGGATWEVPTPSPFYGTLTDPTLGRLRDGRLLFLWNNTLPLPEFPRNEFTDPYILQSAADGSGEDVFTNRDALHGAISDDDGKTWRGFREVLLDGNRNDRKYGETGGIDHSVHQPQFVQVDGDRVLVSTGQHWLHRSLFLFAPDWLLETKRNCDFSNGLEDWSVQGYLKGIQGHCSFDRYESSTLVSSPDGPARQVLQVNRTKRKEAIFPRGGATWNFPEGESGFIEARLRLGKDFGGAQLCLLDRWVNPTDPTVRTLAMYHFPIAADGSIAVNATSTGKLSSDAWHTVRLAWKSGKCELTLDGQALGSTALEHPANPGISYLHFQSTSDHPDQGLLVESVKAEVTPGSH